MIILYDKDATTFTDNGLCVLSPMQCSVSEIAGGKYELHLEHPIDEYGKYAMLVEDYLIKAPVPPTHVGQIKLPETKILKTNKSTDLYSKLPVTKSPPKEAEILTKIRQHWNEYGWSLTRYYNYGDYVTHGTSIYRALKFNFQIAPGTDSSVWAYVSTQTAPTPTYIPGVVAETLANNETVTKVADYNAQYVRVRSLRGVVGFVLREDVDETTQTEEETIPAQDITEQVFRIYQVECDEIQKTVSVDARHISYDFRGNALYDCKFSDAKPMVAIANLQGALMIADDRRIVSNIKNRKITKDWSFKNPINALLDPSDGLVKELNANLIRNNRDFYILKSSSSRTGITIEYGINLLGVKWKRSTENVITRVVPRCNNGSDGYVYLEQMYVDSDIADQYPFTRIEVLDCQYTVGEEYEQPDGTKVKRTEASVRTDMLADAQKRFDDDKVDGIDVTLEVNFILLGDTAEYAQYKGLQTVCLYDIITIKTGLYGVVVEAQVTEYQWDCLHGRYNSIKVGTINSFAQRVPGYRVVNQSITYQKLSPDLINRIRTANASGSTDSGHDGGQTQTGGDGVVAYNDKDHDGIVLKGDGQNKKVWGTDDQGNPGWRESGNIDIVDNLTSQAADKALSANQGRVLNAKFDDYVKIEDIIDNLTSSATNKPLSAKQGKVLAGIAKYANWLPSNGYNPLTSDSGFFCYGINPNLVMAQGYPANFNGYGFVFGCAGSAYPVLFYGTVFGDLALYATNTNTWRIFQ